MKTPFVFGQQATGVDFTDRKRELDQLLTNFGSGINTILISPRRWGKSSLVRKAAETMNRKNKKVVVCFLDLYNIRDEGQFYQQLAHSVINSTIRKIEELMSAVKNYLPKLMPRISLDTPAGEFELGVQWKEIGRTPDEIIDLAERIAEDRNIRIVICIDEFQNIASYEHPIALQKKLRSHWQKHKHVSYCLYGSQRNMLTEVFTSPSMPFYQFGDLMFLQKIPTKDWAVFIHERFRDTGKEISEEVGVRIATLTDRHSNYVQQLAQQAWLRTAQKCNEKIVDEAFDSMLHQMSLLFVDKTNALTTTQINLMEALLNEENQLSSKETIEGYGLGSSANVIRIKDALIRKEILDTDGSHLYFLDPLYKQWLTRHYFKMNSHT